MVPLSLLMLIVSSAHSTGDAHTTLSQNAQPGEAEQVVLFKFKAETTEAQIDAIFERCQQLVETIPFVKRAAFEKSFTTERAMGFTHVARAVLASESDLPAYHSHPSHLECVKDLKPIIEEILAGAYETHRNTSLRLNAQPSEAEQVVLFKFKPETTEAQIDTIFQRCQQLVETIPFVKRAAFEKSFTTERSRGFTHVARAVLANKADLPAYHSHPSHLECLKDLKPVIEENLAVAYETHGH